MPEKTVLIIIQKQNKKKTALFHKKCLSSIRLTEGDSGDMLTLLSHSLVPLLNDPKHNKSYISNMLNAKLFMSLCTSMCVCLRVCMSVLWPTGWFS